MRGVHLKYTGVAAGCYIAIDASGNIVSVIIEMFTSKMKSRKIFFLKKDMLRNSCNFQTLNNSSYTVYYNSTLLIMMLIYVYV